MNLQLLRRRVSLVYSAGFCEIEYYAGEAKVKCYGKSESIKLESIPEKDEFMIGDLFSACSELKYFAFSVENFYKKKLYHVSPIENRNSIEQHGIDTAKGVSPWFSPEDPIDFPKGNYFWNNIEAARNYARGLSDDFDIYEVLCESLTLEEDPITKGGVYVKEPIGKSLIKLIETIKVEEL